MCQTGLFCSGHTFETSYNPEAKIIVYHGDTMDFLQQIPDASINLIITSPPYNIGKKIRKSYFS